MATTLVGLNDAKAVKRWSANLAVDTIRQSYFTSKFMGKGEGTNMPIMMLTDLDEQAGDQVTFDLSVQLRGKATEGDNRDEGREEKLSFYTDNLYIDQQRKSVSAGGKMTRKRTMHNLRTIAKRRMTEYWPRLFDEILFCYLSGARGVNDNFIEDADYTGRATNAFSAPDSSHIIYGGDATSKGTIIAADKMTLALVDRLVAKADMMGGGTAGIPKIQPISIEGENHLVLVMNPIQAYDMRRETGETGWLEIQKALYTSAAKDNPISKGGLGMHNGVVMHKHQAVIRFSDYGTGSPGVLGAARALALGAQAACLAFGQAGKGLRYTWSEESQDRGNELVVTTASIWGAKKSTFNGIDFGTIAIDTAALATA